MGRALSQGRVENVPAEEGVVSFEGGRLRVRARAPVLHLFDETGEVETVVRDGEATLRLHIRDTLRPADEALTLGYFSEQNLVSENQSNVQGLVAGDSALSVRRVVPAEAQSGVLAYLLVTDPAGIGLVVEVLCSDGERCADASVVSADLALRLRAGEALATGETMYMTLNGRRVALGLPADYTITRWNDEDHGGYGVRAEHISGAPAVLEFEHGGYSADASLDNVGEATGRRGRARFGGASLNLREFRRYDGARIWGADLGCTASSCVVLIRGADAGERRRLLALLATAEVTDCTQVVVTPKSGDDDDDDALNLRQTPSAEGDALRQLSVGTRVEVVETRGSWVRLAAPNEGWVWSAQLGRRCERYPR
ncbi:MAG: hypothetical protein ACI9KE_003851 [Polyangiales bacterium]|jgi:hypothetical protein